MNPTIYNFTLDMQSAVSQATLSARRGDRSPRFISVTLTAGGIPYEIEHGCYAVLNAKRESDGKAFFGDCIIKDNSITYSMTDIVSSSEGRLDCDITLYSPEGEAITSPRFAVVVYAGATDGEEIRDTDEFRSLSELVAAAEDAATRAENSAISATHGGAISFNGRVGAVIPKKGDYDAEMVGADPKGAAKEHADDPNAHANLFKAFGISDLQDSMIEMFVAQKTARIESGTYVGTDEYGEEAPNTLEFSFEPKIVFVSSVNSGTKIAVFVKGGNGLCFVSDNTHSESNIYLHATWDGNSLSWYVGSNHYADNQLNKKGHNYIWVAIG